MRAARGLPDDLVRISVGIEDVDDLLAGALPSLMDSIIIIIIISISLSLSSVTAFDIILEPEELRRQLRRSSPHNRLRIGYN